MTKEEKYRIMVQEVMPLEKELYQVVYRSLQRILGKADPRDVEDIVQEVMHSAWDGLGSYQGKSTIRTWVYGIMNNKVKDLIRRNIRDNDVTVPRVIVIKETDEEIDRLEIIPSENDILEEILKTEQRYIIWKALERLGQLDRDIITMKYMEERSSKEIAEYFTLSVSNVDTRTHRALKRLLTEIQKLEGGDDCE